MTDPIQDAHDYLMMALATGDSSFAIEFQERRGQHELLASTRLPSDLNGENRADFEALGFTFGEQVDDLFIEATLPEGWARDGSDHAMWSYIIDERGVRRVAVFYKAAFYDRKAHMNTINVGRDVASGWIYGTDDVLSLNPALTDGERSAARAAAVEYTENADRYPDIYGDRLPRAWALIEQVSA